MKLKSGFFIFGILGIIFLISSVFVIPSTALPGDTPAEAIMISGNSITYGNFPTDGATENDWYIVDLAGDFNFSLNGDALSDFDLEVYDENQVLIQGSYGVTYPEVIDLFNLNGSYFIQILQFSGFGNYDLTIRTLNGGDGFGNAIPISVGSTVRGSLLGPSPTGSIYYSFNIPSSDDYVFSLTGPISTDYDANIYDSTFTTIGSLGSISYPDETTLTLSSGVYYVEILLFSGDPGLFSFGIFLNGVPTNPGDSFDSAIPFSIDSPQTGILPGPSVGGSTFYSFSVLSSDDYLFSLTGPVLTDFDMQIYDSNRVSLGFVSGIVYPDENIFTLLAGDYFIEIIDFSGNGGEYTFSVTPLVGPGQSFINAIPYIIGDIQGGILPGPSAREGIFYSFFVDSPNNYLFSVSGPSGSDYDLEVFNSTQNSIGFAADVVYPDELALFLDPGQYFVEIYRFSGAFGDYTFSVNLENIPGNDFNNAIEIQVENLVFGDLPGPSPDGSLFYRINILNGATYRISLDGPVNTDFNLIIYDNNRIYVDRVSGISYPSELQVYLDIGLYYLQVVMIGNAGGNFNFIIEQIHDAGSSFDDPIEIFGSYDGVLPGPGLNGEIWLIADLSNPEPHNYRFSLNSIDTTNFDFAIFDIDHNPLGNSADVIYPEVIEITDIQGVVLIQITVFSGEGQFQFSIEDLGLSNTISTVDEPSSSLNLNNRSSTTPALPIGFDTPFLIVSAFIGFISINFLKRKK